MGLRCLRAIVRASKGGLHDPLQYLLPRFPTVCQVALKTLPKLEIEPSVPESDIYTIQYQTAHFLSLILRTSDYDPR